MLWCISVMALHAFLISAWEKVRAENLPSRGQGTTTKKENESFSAL